MLVATTFAALEGGEVVVLETVAPDGSARETRVWLAEDEARILWVEAATPERAWYRDVLARPKAVLVRESRPRCVRAVPFPEVEGRARLRALLPRKYGWADAWVGLLQDTSSSIAVRLDPCEEPDG